jgi:AraC family transcriptional regulator
LVSFEFDATSYRGHLHHPRHAHGELQISLVLRGSLAETVRGATEFAGPLSIVVKDPGVEHEDRFGPDGAALVRLRIRRSMADLLDDPRRVIPWSWSHAPGVAAPFIRIARRERASFAADDADVTDLLASLTAREAPLTAPPEWLVRTMTDLRSGWNPSLSVTDVARAADVHPVYLARCVRRWYGVGLAEELRRIRLTTAARGLAEGDATVSRVAHVQGFADEPHLCRAFHQSTGVTPASFRRLVRSIPFVPSAG